MNRSPRCVARGHAAPVLEAAESIFDAVTLAVEHPIVGQRQLARWLAGMHGAMPRCASAVRNQVLS